MAQRVTGFAKKPAARGARAGAAARKAAEAEVSLEAIALDIKPLLKPFKGQGKLSVRIERLPHQARLSAGRNNGDRSWSLALDELEDLEFLHPEGASAAHTLGVRIISLEGGDASTLALLDLPLFADGGPAAVAHNGDVVDIAESAELRRLRSDLAAAKSALAARDAELADARRTARPNIARKAIDAELAAAQSAWEAELDERLAAAAEEAHAGLEKARANWQADQKAHLAVLEKQVEDRIKDEHKAWQREADAALGKAQKAWQADEAARLAEAQALWRAENAVEAKPRAKSKPAADDEASNAFQLLRDDLAAMKAALTAREADLAQARSAVKDASEETARAVNAALAKAEKSWTADEAARRADADAEWQQKLADAQALAKSGLDQTDSELRHLRNAAKTAATALAERETALSDALAAIEQIRNESSARLAAAENAWQAQSAQALAELSARAAHAEAALATAQADAETARGQGDAVLDRLHGALDTANTQLAERELALADTTKRLEDSEAALAKAQANLNLAQGRSSAKLDDLQNELSAAQTRLAARDAELVEAAQRFDKTETALRQARAEVLASRDQGDARLKPLHDEIAALTTRVADRDTEFSALRECFEQSQTALSKAQTDAAAARDKERSTQSALRDEMAAAQAQLNERDAERAKAAAQIERMETALTEARESVQTRGQSDVELRRLRNDLADTRAALASRDAELAQQREFTEQAQERWQRKMEIALAKAEKAWRLEEASRLAAAKADWQTQSAQNENTAQPDWPLPPPPSYAPNAYPPGEYELGRRSREALPVLPTTFSEPIPDYALWRVDAEKAVHRLTADLDQMASQPGRKATQPAEPAMADRNQDVERPGGGNYLMIGGAIAACVAILAIVALFFIVRTDSSSDSSAAQTASAANTGAHVKPEHTTVPKPALPTATIVQAANVRSAPSASAAIAATLPRDSIVAIIEQRGSWFHVGAAPADGKPAKEGWVYKTLLKPNADGAPAQAKTK